MATVPGLDAAIASFSRVFDSAFSGSGFLPPALDSQKEMFKQEFNSIKSMDEDFRAALNLDKRWKTAFEDAITWAYDMHASGKIAAQELEIDRGFRKLIVAGQSLRDQCVALAINSSAAGSQDIGRLHWKSLSRVLELHGFAIATNVLRSDCSDVMNDSDSRLDYRIEELTKSVQKLHELWVELAEFAGDPHGNPNWNPRNADWVISILESWSKAIDKFDHALVVLKVATEYYRVLRGYIYDDVFFRLLYFPSNAGQIATECADLYCSIRSGIDSAAARHLVNIRKYGQELDDWLARLPPPNVETFSARKVRAGQTYFNRGSGEKTYKDFFDDPASISIQSLDNILLGIARLDFQEGRGLGIELNVDELTQAKLKWNQRGGRANLYDTTLNWIQIPDILRSRVHFGEVEINRLSMTAKASPSSGDQVTRCDGADTVRWHDKNSYSCEIQFGKTFSSGKVSAHAWLMDMEVNPGKSNHQNMSVIVRSAQPSGLKLLVSAYGLVDIPHVRLAYCVCEGEDASIDGFWAQTWTADGGVDQNGESVWFYKFSQGKFRSRPAVTSMLSTFQVQNGRNCRVNLSWAATRDGVVVKSNAWADNHLEELQAEIIAISND